MNIKKGLIVLVQAGFLFCLAAFFGSFLIRANKDRSAKSLRITNAQEHIESEEAALRYLSAAEKHQIFKTVILGSPEATLVPGKTGFQHEDENNREILRLSKKYPGKFIIFPTINPANPQKLQQLEDYVRLGARGLKLYSGHKFFHNSALDEPSMLPVYAYCEAHQLPVVFHVNPALYQQEFENVLWRFPNLKVVCPHFCLSAIRTDRFEALMGRHPHLYTNISFGFVEFLNEALVRFAKNPRAYRALVLKYQDRILFGLDLAVTREPYKTAQWLDQMMQGYRDLLEKDHFEFFGLPHVLLSGLNLDLPVLEKIYFKNFDHFFGETVSGG